MHVLVTNDDGIASEGLWRLVGELKRVAEVTVVTPDSERSAIGTAVSLFRPIRVAEVKPFVDGVTAYTADGTPADCVILAMGRLVSDRIDLVVSGINEGSNLGEDVYISGTVGGALQGYFRGSHALAVSAPHNSQGGQTTAAIVAARLAVKIADTHLPSRIFLNVNAPDLAPATVAGVKLTRLARTSHINTVSDAKDERAGYYNLTRTAVSGAGQRGTDMHAKDSGYVSVTPLFTTLFERPPQDFLRKTCAIIARELKDR